MRIFTQFVLVSMLCKFSILNRIYDFPNRILFIIIDKWRHLQTTKRGYSDWRTKAWAHITGKCVFHKFIKYLKTRIHTILQIWVNRMQIEGIILFTEKSIN